MRKKTVGDKSATAEVTPAVVVAHPSGDTKNDAVSDSQGTVKEPSEAARSEADMIKDTSSDKPADAEPPSKAAETSVVAAGSSAGTKDDTPIEKSTTAAESPAKKHKPARIDPNERKQGFSPVKKGGGNIRAYVYAAKMDIMFFCFLHGSKTGEDAYMKPLSDALEDTSTGLAQQLGIVNVSEKNVGIHVVLYTLKYLKVNVVCVIELF
jgi:hypothetical protein